MFHVITPQRMQAMERAFMAETGTPGLLLMERAAQAIAGTLAEMTPEGALFLCGPGNNGGDGYAAARLFAEKGRAAWIWAVSDPALLTGDARENWQRCVALGIPISRFENPPPDAVPDGCGAIVDALFGTGLARPLGGIFAQAVRWMNAAALPILAVDMPSGTPALMVHAAETVTFHMMKPAHLLYPGRIHAGRVTVADIGLPAVPTDAEYAVALPDDIPALLPPRPPDAHKGTCGHALVVAGSTGMAGAACLCANAALRGGAGLVTVCCPAEILPIVQGLAPCATCKTPDQLDAAIIGKAAIGVGPGLGAGDAPDTLLPLLLTKDCPQIWDADALNWLARHPQPLGGQFVLTPHPGEAARLLGCDTPDITDDPLLAATTLHERYGTVVLLKGATTVLVGEGMRALNITGTPGMATGGSGDVLTGLITALLAQGLAPFAAAQTGALLHGMAGRKAARRHGIRSMTAQDMLDALYID